MKYNIINVENKEIVNTVEAVSNYHALLAFRKEIGKDGSLDKDTSDKRYKKAYILKVWGEGKYIARTPEGHLRRHKKKEDVYDHNASFYRNCFGRDAEADEWYEGFFM